MTSLSMYYLALNAPVVVLPLEIWAFIGSLIDNKTSLHAFRGICKDFSTLYIAEMCKQCHKPIHKYYLCNICDHVFHQECIFTQIDMQHSYCKKMCL